MLEMVEGAITAGVDEIAITDHYERAEVYDAARYFDTIEKLRKLYGKKIIIKSGVELGTPFLHTAKTKKLLAEYPYDFVLASVHEIEGVFLESIDFESVEIDKVMKQYFLDLIKVIEFGEFDCLAHLDLPKRYIHSYGKEVNIMDYKCEILDVLVLVLKNNKGIEVNSSGFNGSMMKMMPDVDVLKMYYDIGGRIVTVGSDAHNAGAIGKGVRAAMDMLRGIGFEYVARYSKREVDFVRI